MVRCMNLCISFILTFGAGTVSGESTPFVSTQSGIVVGSNLDGVNEFLGIPFAAPPTGELRWQAPQPPIPWSGELDATNWPVACPQEEDGTAFGGEDCLYLNIWTPENAAPGSLPVMFFIHGGGNVSGSSSVVQAGTRLYDGRLPALRGNVVVVTTQYRIGALGFLVHPALSRGSLQGTSGNYGLLDQQAALRWVQSNIEAFGGNPERVLLFGESGGATDTLMQLVSPLAGGLFSRALMESGGNRAESAAERAAEGIAFAEAAGCPSTETAGECLHNLSAEELVRAVDLVDSNGTISNGIVSSYFGPTVDGWVLPEDPAEALAAGHFNHLPFVVGANSDEMRSYVPELSEAAYEALVRSILAPWGGAVIEHALELYPVGPGGYATGTDAYSAFISDPQFVCPTRRFASDAAGGQDEPVYRYFFTHGLDGPWWGPYGAFHGLELFFVFQKLEEMDGYYPRAADLELETSILQLWTSFAATGVPSIPEPPSWPSYEPGQDLFMELDIPIETGNGIRTEKCDFWDSIINPPPLPRLPEGRAAAR